MGMILYNVTCISKKEPEQKKNEIILFTSDLVRDNVQFKKYRKFFNILFNKT